MQNVYQTVHPADDPVTHWHTLDRSEVSGRLVVDPSSGLSEPEASRRLEQHGANAIREKPPRPAWRMFLDQFADFMILVLIAAAVVSGVVGDMEDTLVIAAIVLLNAVIGFFQEMRAEQAMAALKKMAATNAVVLRNGLRQLVPAAEVVPGDIVVLEAGNVVPADVRLIEAIQLKADEAILTGEAVAAEKTSAALDAPGLATGDKRNMAFKGTTATAGRGIYRPLFARPT